MATGTGFVAISQAVYTNNETQKSNDFYKFTLNVFIHAVSFSLFHKLYKQRNTENRMTYINID